MLAVAIEEIDQGRHSIYNWMPNKFGNNPCSGYLLKSWQDAAKENRRLSTRRQNSLAFWRLVNEHRGD